MKWANQNPKAAKVLAGRSQTIFKQSLVLSRQIKKSINEAVAANVSYLAEFTRFSKSLKTGEDHAKHKEWIPLARQSRELIPHATGKILLSLSEIDPSIDVITAPWIATSPQDATKLLPHNVQTCPFCGLNIRNANALVRNRKTLYSQNIESHAKTYSSEPFLFHECINWLDKKGNLVDYDSALPSIGLVIRADHSLIPIERLVTETYLQSSHAKLRKRSKFLKISKKSALYRSLSRWGKRFKSDSLINKFMIWCYIKFFAISEEL